jgi:uncharacterized protein (TIGR03067 family)
MKRYEIGLALLTLVLAAPAWAKEMRAEDEELYGTWVLASVEIMDQATPVPQGTQSSTFSRGGRVAIQIKGKPDLEATWKVFPARSPTEIDVILPTKEGEKPQISKAIYQVDGDLLKVAVSTNGSELPLAFNSTTSRILIFKRQKP